MPLQNPPSDRALTAAQPIEDVGPQGPEVRACKLLTPPRAPEPTRGHRHRRSLRATPKPEHSGHEGLWGQESADIQPPGAPGTTHWGLRKPSLNLKGTRCKESFTLAKCPPEKVAEFRGLQPQHPATPPSDQALTAAQPSANVGHRSLRSGLANSRPPQSPRANQGPPTQKEPQSSAQARTPGPQRS